MTKSMSPSIGLARGLMYAVLLSSLITAMLITVAKAGTSMMAQISGNAAVVTMAENRREATGTITARIYHEDGDYMSVQVTTEDGNIWTLDDYDAAMGTECRLTFDTNGTLWTVEDDHILEIITRTRLD